MQDQNNLKHGHSNDQGLAISIINSIINRSNVTLVVYDAASSYVPDSNLYEPTDIAFTGNISGTF